MRIEALDRILQKLFLTETDVTASHVIQMRDLVLRRLSVPKPSSILTRDGEGINDLGYLNVVICSDVNIRNFIYALWRPRLAPGTCLASAINHQIQ